MLEAARTIGLGSNLPDLVTPEAIVIIGATMVPLVPLLYSDKRLPPAVRAHLEVVQVGRDCRHLSVPVAVVGRAAL